MKSAFDSEAHSYDRDFTLSLIGQYQRKLVWEYLEKFNDKSLKILEVNCGTGEDALFLTSKGHRVNACDVSEEMIHVATQKASKMGLDIAFFQKDIRDLDDSDFEGVDIVFSNFGGLNCVNKRELEDFIAKADVYLPKNASIIAVVMPSFCLIESIYFLLKMRFGDVFRRMNRSGAKWKGGEYSIHYFSPKSLRRASKGMKQVHLQGIGLFTPPSYLNQLAEKNKRLFKTLISLDKIFSRIPLSSYLSDHYLIHLQKTE